MKLIPVVIKGKVHRLSERALELLNLERVEDKPIALQKLPPNLEILKIQKAEVKEIKEVVPEQPVEVKKNEDVTVESTEKIIKRRRRGKVGTKK